MNEIFFRGKDVDGNWRYGYFSAYHTPQILELRDGIVSAYPVDLSTVGQFTGLRDCNGERIYPGDVISPPESGVPSDDDGEVGVVRDATVDKYGNGFDVDIFCYAFELPTADEGCNLSKAHREWQIIGNIYDNPNIIKQTLENGLRQRIVREVEQCERSLESRPDVCDVEQYDPDLEARLERFNRRKTKTLDKNPDGSWWEEYPPDSDGDVAWGYFHDDCLKVGLADGQIEISGNPEYRYYECNCFSLLIDAGFLSNGEVQESDVKDLMRKVEAAYQKYSVQMR